MNSKKTASKDETKLPSTITIEDVTSYLKGMMEREAISYHAQKELYQKRRSSLTAPSSDDASLSNASFYATATDVSGIHGSGPASKEDSSGQKADMTSFTALKNLDESKLSMSRHPLDSISCDYDTLCQLQRQPADLSGLCTTGNARRMPTPPDSDNVKTIDDFMKSFVGSTISGKRVDTTSQFFNNFYG
ncbi:hypothetical protein ACHAWO_003861 [Cyclotella atomus]|uniref:Uncharacterized protein n=1 Tax=Cyclotella atomus TaxID=382360 RepID=A0ABD3QV22_9STRA